MRPNTLRMVRRYHQYLGLFFAPMILLFAVSGALQTFRLNEAKGYGGPPPTWMVWIASVHKDQGPPREPRKEKPKLAADQPRPGADAGARLVKRPSPLPLKIFVVLLSIALAVSTIMGVMIALANRALRRRSLALLALGTVMPIVLLWI